MTVLSVGSRTNLDTEIYLIVSILKMKTVTLILIFTLSYKTTNPYIEKTKSQTRWSFDVWEGIYEVDPYFVEGTLNGQIYLQFGLVFRKYPQ